MRPFRLYAATMETASSYAGVGPCALCQNESEGRIELSASTDLVHRCEQCGTRFAYSATETTPPCPQCDTRAHLPSHGVDAAVCFTCIKDERAALTKDTEYGMVTWQDAIQGRTQGIPWVASVGEGLSLNEPDDDGWATVNIPGLLELVHTPTYSSWQGENWRFCCASPMVYEGEANSRADFAAYGDPRQAFLDITEHQDPSMWEYLPEDTAASWGVHVFRCATCDRLRGHLDAS